MAAVLHPTYLPFTADQLMAHFAPVLGDGELDRHLRYYRASVKQAKMHADRLSDGLKPTPAQIRLPQADGKRREILGSHRADEPVPRGWGRCSQPAVQPPAREGRLAPSGAICPVGGGAFRRARALFRSQPPIPPSYQLWLRDHLDERAPIPYLRERAEAAGTRLEGPTKADAMLLAPDTGVAVIFEAKVLSDISTHITFDLARNQLARIIDVMLEANPKLQAPLRRREPGRTFMMLLTPAFLRPVATGNAAGSRLYGWLMPAYQDPDNPLLQQHLPHRDHHALAKVANRLGWASWEDIHTLLPGACPWLAAVPKPHDETAT